MIAKHLRLIDEAGARGVQILCLQELFYGPYFAAEQDVRWYAFTERVPDGPAVRLMQEQARKHRMAMVVPVYEEEATGVYYNTAAVLDADGSYLGKYRKNHIPHCLPGFWEKFYFKPGNLGYPVFRTRYATIGVYICYDRHFPEGGRLLGLHGAEIVFVPRPPPAATPTTSGRSSRRRWRSRTGTSWGPTTAWAARLPGTSASSTAPRTSAIPTVRSWPRAAATGTSWWWRTSTST